MYISNLLGQGVKGQNFEHKLTPLVLFTGPNFAGKTARLEAIRFAFLGYLPELGKQNFATWDMIKGRVELKFDNGQGVTRTTRLAADTVKVEGGGVGGFELPERPLPFLNGKEYFGLTESDQIQYVFRVMNVPDSYSIDGILADLRNITLEENTENTEAAKNNVVTTAQKAFSEHGISGGLTELTKDKGLLKTAFGFYNKRAKETIGTVRVLSELKTSAGDVSAETLAGVRDELKAIGIELAVANQKVGELSGKAMAANKATLRKQQLETALGEVVPSSDAEIERLQKQIDDTKLPDITPEQVAEKGKALNAANESVATIAAQRDNLLDQINEIEETLGSLEKLKQCPTCKAAGKNWKVAAKKEYKEQVAALKKTYSGLDKQVVALRKKVDRARDAVNAANNQLEARQRAQQGIDAATRQIEQLRAAARSKDESRRQMSEELANNPAVTAPSQEELNAAAEAVSKLQAKEQVLKLSETRLVSLQADLMNAERAALEHHKAAAMVAVIKAAGEKLKERQRDMIDNLFGGLIERANYFTDGILNYRLSFIDGEIGKVTPTGFVGHRLFSGTEEALTYVAIAAALSKDAPIRLVLLDEMGRLDHARKRLVADRLQSAVHDGIIDQVIAIDTNAESYALTNEWQIIDVSK